MKFETHVANFFFKFPDLDKPENREIVEVVNHRLDQFAHFPNYETLSRHRKFLHHEEGVEYFNLVYGTVGRLAAQEHIIEDCGWVPKAMDYYTGRADEFGSKMIE